MLHTTEAATWGVIPYRTARRGCGTQYGPPRGTPYATGSAKWDVVPNKSDGEIVQGRSPAMAIVEDGYPVSVCFCARRSHEAAEAGLETAEAYRGRGYGPRVAAAWALAVRASGRIPLYSTSWNNAASLAVARKLGLIVYASGWSLHDSPEYM